ncbi:acyltransferase [Phycicoccus sp. CSK15P-2]|uniref:acyltransferase family protein n=1 Tax=Phycicoccus sp. CSK15P-2 TaxID=2807627 RepID=UPI00194E9EE5|nr:acyltransferase [Phycicoccus sp. CSK15P-2]MBM6405972.1 acyltransferase [Phycicoccus sp. CSK15P-2]
MTTRVAALDGVRGVAILLVLVAHGLGVVSAGVLGVLLFFVLSGFLITGILAAEVELTGGLSFRRFYARRALRLVPALVGFLVALLAVSLLPGTRISPAEVFRAAVESLTYTTNLTVGLGLDLVPEAEHLWTLAVEEQFYLVWPLAVLVVLRRNTTDGTVRAVAWILGGAVVVRLLTLVLSVQAGWYFYVLPTTWGDPLVAGSLLAVTLRARPDLLDRTRAVLLRGSVCALMAIVMLGMALWPGTYWSPAFYVAGVPLATVAALQLVLAATSGSPPRWAGVLSHPWLRYLGTRSYALYLYNSAAILVLRDLMPARAAAVVGVAAALVLAELSWRLVERPALRAKRHVEARPLMLEASSREARRT